MHAESCVLLTIPFSEKITESVDKGRAANVIHIDFGTGLTLSRTIPLCPSLDIIVWMGSQLGGNETNGTVRPRVSQLMGHALPGGQ